jgi:hypothetical protein
MRKCACGRSYRGRKATCEPCLIAGYAAKSHLKRKPRRAKPRICATSDCYGIAEWRKKRCRECRERLTEQQTRQARQTVERTTSSAMRYSVDAIREQVARMEARDPWYAGRPW